jgi:methyl-accepting chemotaxis protein
MEPKKTHYRSLKWQLIVSIVPILVVASAAVMLFVYYISRSSMISITDELVVTQSEAVSARFSAWSDALAAQIDLAASLIENGTLATPEEVSEFIIDHKGILINCEEDFYVVYNDTGLLVDNKGYSKNLQDIDKSLLDEEWYQFGLSQTEVGFDGCSKYEEDGKTQYSITITKQLVDEKGNLIGIIAADAFLDSMSNLLAEVKNEDTHILLLDSKSSMVIGATETGLIGYSSGEGNAFADQAIADMESGTFSTRYTKDGETLFASAVPVSGTPWYLITYTESDTALASLKPLLNTAIGSILGMAVLIVLIVLLVVSSQTRTLAASKKAISEIAEGDFTVALPRSDQKFQNEITQINVELKDLVSSLRGLLHDVNQTSNLVSEQSQSFHQMANSLNQDSTEENAALHELTGNIHEISESIQTLADHASSLAALASDTRSNSVEANEKMATSVQSSKKTAEDMQTISASIRSTEQSMTELSRLVQEVQANTQQIESITEVIKSIAEQTNLLSLNASIEAARAGESGRGFAVVADEIKHLAEDSSHNAEEITARILSITGLISSTAASTEKSLGEITDSVRLMDTLSAAFEDMSHNLYDTEQMLSNVNENIEQVSDISASIAAISQEQAASSEEVLSTTFHIEELVDQTKEKSDALQNGTKELSEASEHLKEYMDKFVL